jgi:hypothetical protein
VGGNALYFSSSFDLVRPVGELWKIPHFIDEFSHTHIRGIEIHTGIYREGSTFSLLSKGGVDSLKKYKRNDKV